MDVGPGGAPRGKACLKIEISDTATGTEMLRRKQMVISKFTTLPRYGKILSIPNLTADAGLSVLQQTSAEMRLSGAQC